MNEAPTAQVNEQTNESQVRRAHRGVVAGYIHQLSERHAHRRPSSWKPSRRPSPAAGADPSGHAPMVHPAVNAPPAGECLPAAAARPGRTGSRALRAPTRGPARS